MSLGIVNILRISEKFYDLQNIWLYLHKAHFTMYYYSKPFNDGDGIFVTVPIRLVQHEITSQYGTLRVK